MKHLRCHFASKGFTKDGTFFKPCDISYHVDCIRVGEPFRSRLPEKQGLFFPNMDGLPVFVCEACSVRSVLLRELRPSKSDKILLKLEQMRMIDMASRWAQNTLRHYQSYFRRIREFESIFGCRVLTPPTLTSLPGSSVLPALWCQQWYAVQKPSRGRRSKYANQMTYGTVRGLRSAVGIFSLWEMLLRYPGRVIMTPDQKNLLTTRALPNECVEYSLMAEGMARRMGIHTTPPPLLFGDVTFGGY